LVTKSIGAVVLVTAFVSTAAFYWDEIAAPLIPGVERPKVIEAILWLPWYGWSLIGLVILIALIGEHAFKLISNAEVALEAQLARTEATPEVRPVGYGKAEDGINSGIFLRSGYDAYQVRIPRAPIGNSGLVIDVPDRLANLGERDHRKFLSVWLEDETKSRSGCDGGQLYSFMSFNGIPNVPFKILFEDGKFNTWAVDCEFLISDPPGKLWVRALRQYEVKHLRYLDTA
jgi:hypothetical protein